MRLISTVLLCLLIIGGTWIYTRIDSNFKRDAVEVLYADASGITSVTIERSFECFGDPDFKEPAIRVRFQGQDAFTDGSKVLAPETPIEFELEGVEVLGNVITVSANVISPDSFGDAPAGLRAMLVKVHYDKKLIAEEMFYADGTGISIDGEVTFQIPQTEDDHGHVH